METEDRLNVLEKPLDKAQQSKVPKTKILMIVAVMMALALIIAGMWFLVLSPTEDENTWTEITGEAISPYEAENYIGEFKIVEGIITDTHYSSGSNTVFLNFGGAYPNHDFTAVIFASNLEKFPDNPDTYYYGKTVRVQGFIEDYQGKPQIILENLHQIEIGE